MISTQIKDSVLALPENDRLVLACRIVKSVATDCNIAEVDDEGARRMGKVVTGGAQGSSEEEYRRALG